MSTTSDPGPQVKPKYDDLSPREKRRINIQLGLGAAAVLAVFVLCVVKMSTKEDVPVDLGSDAKRVCRDFVEKRLKAPATADFGGEAATSDGDMFTVTGHVDAQNSFGALIRSNYTCVVRSSGTQWVLSSITGLG